MLAQIVGMVAAAQRSRAPIQKYADKVAGVFVPVVIGIAMLAFTGWAIWGPAPALSYALVASGQGDEADARLAAVSRDAGDPVRNEDGSGRAS